jgi:cytochrome c-type biogenesis protein CcmH
MTPRRLFSSLLLAATLLAAAPAAAVQPDEVLQDPALEARARAISANLRCLVCQNQSIDDSDAPLAKDLRLLVRERLKAGDGDPEIVDFVVARYGEFVLLKPRLSPQTLILWFATPALFLAALAGIALALRRRKSAAAAPAPLSREENAGWQPKNRKDARRRRQVNLPFDPLSGIHLISSRRTAIGP